jgi:hypothetical protein
LSDTKVLKEMMVKGPMRSKDETLAVGVARKRASVLAVVKDAKTNMRTNKKPGRTVAVW